eukprot:TRINITY_DN22836_c0_g1_i1.p1 TRINITY_DN22836_c0_g1~~TRINITY_DN22836_c0_g1_i1.p1  ORF type:complete len:484 (+),score=158.08 TRINITY_DN22836_c0_g1_i1:65-1453(+)
MPATHRDAAHFAQPLRKAGLGVMAPGARVSEVRVSVGDAALASLEVKWTNGASKAHGAVPAAGAAGVRAERLVCETGEYITKVTVGCSKSLQMVVTTLAISTNKGQTLEMAAPKTLGQSASHTLEAPEGHMVVGFLGRVDGAALTALGLLTFPVEQTPGGSTEPMKGPIVGGPVGESFSDHTLWDHSQLNAFVLRTSFRRESQSSAMLDAAQRIFDELSRACADSTGVKDHAKHDAMLQQASDFFGASVRRVQSPVHGTPRCSRVPGHDRAFTDGGIPFPLAMDPFASDFGISEDGGTARCLVSAAWRSISSNTPLPLDAGDAVVVRLHFVDIRTAAVGLHAGFIDEADSSWYVGSDAHSIAYQSTGHVVAGGVLEKAASQVPLRGGDRLTVFATKTHVSFLKGAQVLARREHALQNPYLTLSAYLGPNTFTILGCTVVEKGSTTAADLMSEKFMAKFTDAE